MSLSDRDFVMRRARQIMIRRIVRQKALALVGARRSGEGEEHRDVSLSNTPYGLCRQTRTKSSTECR